MLASYHNHSQYSDGKATIEQMATAADVMGISELGISDHFVVPLQGPPPRWSMQEISLPAYALEIQTVNQQSNCEMRLGLELDWFPDMAQRIAATIEPVELDYVIGSVHHVGAFCIDGASAKWSVLDQDQCNRVHEHYWQLMRSMAESGFCDIVAHIDLPKKFGFLPTQDLSAVIDPALDAIANAGMIVELNTAGWHKRCQDAYPSVELLEACYARQIPVTISADAHLPSDLLRDFTLAAQRLARVGYDQVARFKQRQVWFEPLADAIPEEGDSPTGLDPF